MPVVYRRLPRLLEELEIAREAGNLTTVRTQLARMKLLVLDDWGVSPLGRRARQDLLEVIDDRVGSALIATTRCLCSKCRDKFQRAHFGPHAGYARG